MFLHSHNAGIFHLLFIAGAISSYQIGMTFFVGDARIFLIHSTNKSKQIVIFHFSFFKERVIIHNIVSNALVGIYDDVPVVGYPGIMVTLGLIINKCRMDRRHFVG